MAISTSEFLGQAYLEARDLDTRDLKNNFHELILQTSLKQFVHQFGLSGCSLLRFSPERQKPDQVGYYWNELFVNNPVPQLELGFNWQQVFTAPPLDIRLIEDGDHSGSYYLYGCLCSHNSESLYYLLCWHQMPISEHQSYGMSLYAQTLNQQPFPQPEKRGTQTLNELLHRTRHQLRTPLSLMLLYVDLLKATSVDSRSQQWLEDLRAAAEEMHLSLDRLTESAVSVEPEVTSCDLRQLLQQCCQKMQPWIQQKNLTLVYDSQPSWLRVDGWKIQQVFQNLLSNAIAFTPMGGQITCEWQTFQTEVLIKIRDGGPGLTAEDLRSLGTPFYSRRSGGTGLGVFIAKQFILEHQGSLWAENLPTGGAQFCITLPRRT